MSGRFRIHCRVGICNKWLLRCPRQEHSVAIATIYVAKIHGGQRTRGSLTVNRALLSMKYKMLQLLDVGKYGARRIFQLLVAAE